MIKRTLLLLSLAASISTLSLLSASAEAPLNVETSANNEPAVNAEPAVSAPSAVASPATDSLATPANNSSTNSAPTNNAPVENNNTFSLTPVVNPEVVANFPLDEAFLTKMAKVHQQLPSLPQEPNNPEYGNDTSINGLIAIVEFKPKLMKLLSDNGLTAQDYVVGSMALAATLTAASAEGEDQFFDEANTVSPANLEFGKKHIDEIRAILE